MQPPPHPGRCDSCSLGAQLSGPPSLGCPLGWQGLLQVAPQSSLPLSQVSPEVLQDMGALVWLRQAELLNCVWGQGAAGQFVHQLVPATPAGALGAPSSLSPTPAPARDGLGSSFLQLALTRTGRGSPCRLAQASCPPCAD